MSIKSYQVLGLMSGSSLDGLDIAFCTFEIDSKKRNENPILSWTLEQAATLPFSEKWQARLYHLPQQDALSFCKTNTYFGHYTGALVNEFLAKFQVQPDFIAAHGHTIFHFPNNRLTVQIGDGAALAASTGFPVVCDFRTYDIALDGEGAPLAPLADKLLLDQHDFYLNLGGIANISANINGKFIAFDVGPANQVLNALANQIELAYDEGGKIAAQGQVIKALLDEVSQIDFFQQDYPKSLDNQWVQKNVVPLYIRHHGSWKDKLCTASEQMATEISKCIYNVIKKENLQKKQYTLLATGGGAFNDFVIQRIKYHCPNIDIVLPPVEIIQFKEAILMALMGVLRLENIPNCLRSSTGAKIDTIGGAFYQGTKNII